MDRAQENHATLSSYITGFALSLALTLSAYFVVTNKVLSHVMTLASIGVLAFLQLLVQLFFFLHVGVEKKPRWKMAILLFMVIILLILVLGSIWVMYSLNYRMMSPHQMDVYMKNQSGL